MLNSTGAGLYPIPTTSKINRTQRSSNLSFKANLKQLEQPTERTITMLIAMTNAHGKINKFAEEALNEGFFSKLIYKPLSKFISKIEPEQTNEMKKRAYLSGILTSLPEVLKTSKGNGFEVSETCLRTIAQLLNKSESHKEARTAIKKFLLVTDIMQNIAKAKLKNS